MFQHRGVEPAARIEALAAEIHETFLETAKRIGRPLRPETDVPYEHLPEPEKELNRALARWHLRRVGVLR